MKYTISQLREIARIKLANRYTGTDIENAMDLAAKTMNSFYRLCGIEERLLYLENTESTCDLKSTVELAARRDKWFERLNKVFKDNFNAELKYFGYLPTICEKGSTQDLYLRCFYK